MSDLTLTLPAGFADGNLMEASHFSVPVGEVENWVNGLVGYDGVGDDNWDGTEALRGINFRKNAVKQGWVRSEPDPWITVGSVALSAGPPHGILGSPLGGCSIRFYLRHDAEWVAIMLSVRVLDHSVLGAGGINIVWDYAGIAIADFNSSVVGAPANSVRSYSALAITTTSVTAGWHDVRCTAATSAIKSMVTEASELGIVAAYR